MRNVCKTRSQTEFKVAEIATHVASIGDDSIVTNTVTYRMVAGRVVRRELVEITHLVVGDMIGEGCRFSNLNGTHNVAVFEPSNPRCTIFLACLFNIATTTPLMHVGRIEVFISVITVSFFQ